MTVFEKLDDLEKLYKEGGLKGGIEKLLTNLSNNTITISNADPYLIDFYYLNMNYEQFIHDINNLSNQEIMKFFEVEKSSNQVKSSSIINLRGIFFRDPATKLNKLFDIIEKLIENKDRITDLGVVELIDGLYHNLKVLILFLDKSEAENVDLSYLGANDVYDFSYDGEEFDYIEEDSDEWFEEEDDFGIGEESDKSDSGTEKDGKDSDSDAGDGEKKDKKIEGAMKMKDRIRAIAQMGFKLKLGLNKFLTKTNAWFNKMNVSREMFYKSFFGKIDHLYEHYSREAEVRENELAGDPVEIYKNKALPYLMHLIDSIMKVYHDYMNFNQMLSKSNNYETMVNQVNNYVQYEGSKEKLQPGKNGFVKPGAVIEALKLDYRFKVANVILTNHKIYGYTAESMVVKKFPPMNHVMVCHFMEKPHEKAVTQSVSEVFHSAESFKMMALKFRQELKGMIDTVNAKLGNVDLTNAYKASNGVSENFKQMAMSQMKALGARGEEGKKDIQDLKLRLAVLKDWGSLLASFGPTFLYLTDAGETLFRIMLRIDQTCRLALESMAKVEASKLDPSDGGYSDGTRKFKYQMTPEEKAEAAERKAANDPNRFKKPIKENHSLGTVTYK